ncbi:MAG: VOC family protein [Pseudomonadota bacterium]
MTGIIHALDHFVMTVADIDATVDFYTRHLGMEVVSFGPEGRQALVFGAQKINLHRAAAPYRPHARVTRAGTADFCLLTTVPVAELAERLRAGGVEIEAGPVAKTGARRPLMSIYFRDPDGNLVEVSNEQ